MSRGSVVIVIAANRTRGQWTYDLQGIKRPHRGAGHLRGESSTHTLLAAALTAALVQIDERARKNIADKTGAKPTVAIHVSDAAFVTALQGRMRGQKNPQDGFRVGKNFVPPLYRQLVRFNVVLSIDDDDAKKFSSLSRWAAMTLDSTAPSAFTPSVIAE